MSPPPFPLKPMHKHPLFFASCKAKITFFELPLVDIPIAISPLVAKASICLLKTTS